MPKTVLLVVLGCATALAACGGSEKPAAAPAPAKTADQIPGDTPNSDAADAKQAAAGYMAAFVAGDGEKACSLMTDKAIAGVIEDGDERTAEQAFDLCVETVSSLSGLLEGAEKRELEHPTFGAIAVDGDTATVTVHGDEFKLERGDDGWLLADGPA